MHAKIRIFVNIKQINIYLFDYHAFKKQKGPKRSFQKLF